MKEPIWLQKSLVLAIHEMLLAEHGGPAGLRDEGLLDSALGRPLNQFFYESANLHQLAAAYAAGISMNHPFVDGNKRTAFVAMQTFLQRNETFLVFPKKEAITVFYALAAGDLNEIELAAWIETNAR